MEINKLPDIYDYWLTDPCLHYAPIVSKNIMEKVYGNQIIFAFCKQGYHYTTWTAWVRQAGTILTYF